MRPSNEVNQPSRAGCFHFRRKKILHFQCVFLILHGNACPGRALVDGAHKEHKTYLAGLQELRQVLSLARVGFPQLAHMDV